MAALKDMLGERFDRLAVVARGPNHGTRAAWICLCDCGETTTVTGKDLRSGNTRSCGCLHREVVREVGREMTHGHARGGECSPTYISWRSMRARTTNPNFPCWADYGGRGITCCDRWASFDNFLADMGERPTGTSIDRIDNDGNYEPANCRWATPKEQANNRRPRAAA